MSTEENSDAAPREHRKKKSSTATKLIQAAALAAALVPLGSVAMEADTLTCGFTTGFSGSYGGEGCTNSSPDSNRFDFGEYWLELMFIGVVQDFDVTVKTTESTTYVQSKATAFPGYTCIGITTEGQCVDFEILAEGEPGTHWEHYEIEIHWDIKVGDPARMTLLHDAGITLTRDYDFDVCLGVGAYGPYDPCVIDPDPGIRSGDTDFQSMAPFERNVSVPEPSSLALLGLGAGGVLLRRRRAKL